jgi:hypothetical protein
VSQVEALRPRLILLLGRHSHRLIEPMTAPCPAFMDLAPVVVGRHRTQLLALYHPSPAKQRVHVPVTDLFGAGGKQLLAVYGGVIGATRTRLTARRGANIAKLAAARKLLTLVYYGLRDGHIRCLARPA